MGILWAQHDSGWTHCTDPGAHSNSGQAIPLAEGRVCAISNPTTAAMGCEKSKQLSLTPGTYSCALVGRWLWYGRANARFIGSTPLVNKAANKVNAGLPSNGRFV
jgi:hypothetical protein